MHNFVFSQQYPLRLLILVALCGTVLCHGGHHGAPPLQRLLVVSLDGFRYDFLDRGVMPHLTKLSKNGVRADSMTSSYITKTFPNHLSIVTGLYEESHGIIANKMWDPLTNATYDHGHCTSGHCGDWYTGQPIWNTNEFSPPVTRRRSGVIYWPGDASGINNHTCAYEVPYNGSAEALTLQGKFDLVLDWFKPADTSTLPINLGLIYHNQPDATCHHAGPESANVTEALAAIDLDIGYLLDKAKERDLDLNIVFLSDHGFAEVEPEGVYLVEDCGLDPHTFTILQNKPVMGIWPHTPEDHASILSKLEACHSKGVDVFLNTSVELKSKHYSNNPRIAPIIATSRPGKTSAKLLLLQNTSSVFEKGDHGWNNTWEKMHAFFVAVGPSFKQGYRHPTFDNVNVYELMCEILGIEPAPNNGSLSVLKDMLQAQQKADNGGTTLITVASVALFCALVSGVLIVGACRIKRKSVAHYRPSNGRAGPEQSTLLEASSDDEF